MSANINVYSKNLLNFVDSNKINKAIWQGLFLSEYGNSANFKKLFFLDDVIIQKDSQGRQVIIGLIELNGVNATMRDAKRLSTVRQVKNNKEYIALNDSGLNTYAAIETLLVGENVYSNYLKFSHNIQSAFYSPTREYGVYITIKQADATIVAENIKYSLTNIIASKANKIIEHIITSQVAPADFVKGNRLFVTPYVVNDEGEKKYKEFILTIKASLITVIVTKVDSLSSKPTSQEFNAYIDGDEYDKMLRLEKSSTAQDTGIHLYRDKELKEKLDSSWYNIISYPKIGSFTANQLGAYSGVKACILVNANSSVTTWSEGAWVDETYVVRIWIDPEYVKTETGSMLLMSYTLHIDNSTTRAETNLVIDVYTRNNNTNVSRIYRHEIAQVDANSNYSSYTFKFTGSTDTASGINNINLVCNKTTDQYKIVTPYWIPISQE